METNWEEKVSLIIGNVYNLHKYEGKTLKDAIKISNLTPDEFTSKVIDLLNGDWTLLGSGQKEKIEELRFLNTCLSICKKGSVLDKGAEFFINRGQYQYAINYISCRSNPDLIRKIKEAVKNIPHYRQEIAQALMI